MSLLLLFNGFEIVAGPSGGAHFGYTWANMAGHTFNNVSLPTTTWTVQ